MLCHTHTAQAPWHIVNANDKRTARLNLIRHLLSRLKYRGKDNDLLVFDPTIVFAFSEPRLTDGSMAR
jgi:hypothetical protein